MTPVALAEELLLLAYDDETGKATGSRIGLDLGMAAAVLVELALAGRVGLQDGTIVVIDDTPTGEPVSDAVLAKLASTPANSPTSWVQRLRHGLRERVLGDLCARGVVRDVDETTMEFIHLHRYPVVDRSVEQEVRVRLAGALTGTGVPDERTAALATLVAATRMEPVLRLPPEDAAAAHARLAEIARQAGYDGGVGLEDSTVRPSVAVVIAALYRAIETALGRAA